MAWAPKSVFITGCSRGIGLEFVRQILQLPDPPKHLIASCRNPEMAEELQSLAKSNPSLKILQLDVADVDSYGRVKDEIQSTVGDEGLTALINNAGIMGPRSLEQTTKEVMMELFMINTVGPLLIAKELLPLLKKASNNYSETGFSPNRSIIINITSKMGSISDNSSGSTYGYRASKAGLNIVTKSLSIDLKNDGILSLSLHPGWVKTDITGNTGLITAEQCVTSSLNVIASLTEEQSGNMIAFDGKGIPW